MKLTCTNCTKKFERRQSWANKSKNHFCSRSCSASYNNRKTPKRKAKVKPCPDCGSNFSGQNKYCSDCNPLTKNKTIGDILDNHSCHRSTAYSRVRQRARTIASGLGWKSCKNCGYDKHIEVCHIKGISSFSLSAKIAEVNSPENLIPLCRNCHWEFDNGLLKLS
jgi:5-methylcytosine-specific restriction endonuclease McrA